MNKYKTARDILDVIAYARNMSVYCAPCAAPALLQQVMNQTPEQLSLLPVEQQQQQQALQLQQMRDQFLSQATQQVIYMHSCIREASMIHNIVS